MSSKPSEGYRMVCRKSMTNYFNLERFAYDVFAYMLRICGFPENKIPTADLKENTYKEEFFVMNVCLSALPVALYKRDEWRSMFKNSIPENKIQTFITISHSLELLSSCCMEFDIDNPQSKVQFSLALYIEFILYQNCKDPETDFGRLPKIWSSVCKRLLVKTDQTFESIFTMCPDISESWITDFIHKFAIPYGNINNISYMFSIYVLNGSTETDMLCDETSTESVTNAPKEIVPQPSNVSDEYSKSFHPENTNSGLNCTPGRLVGSSEQTSNLYFLQTSAISKEYPTTFSPKTIDSASKYTPKRLGGYSGKLQTSKKYILHSSTPEGDDSIKFFPENINSETYRLKIWERLEKIRTSTESDPKPSGTSDEYSSNFFHENTEAGLNYIPGGWSGYPGHLQTSKESAPQSSGTSEEDSVKIFPEITNSENNFVQRWARYSGQLQTSKEHGPRSSTPEENDSIKFFPKTINSETYRLKNWERLEKIRASTDPKSSGTSDEYSSNFFHENTEAGLNYIPEGWSGYSGHLQTSKKSAPQSSGTSEENSVKIFPGITNSENNFVQRRGARYSGQLQTSKEYIPRSSAPEEYYLIKIFPKKINSETCRPTIWEILEQIRNFTKSDPQSSDTSGENSVKLFPENLNSDTPGRWNLPTSSDQQQISEESGCIETKAYGRNINGLNYVLKQCIKKRKRNMSEELVIDDLFQKMDIDEENISPENPYIKRRCKMSDDIFQ